MKKILLILGILIFSSCEKEEPIVYSFPIVGTTYESIDGKYSIHFSNNNICVEHTKVLYGVEINSGWWNISGNKVHWGIGMNRYKGEVFPLYLIVSPKDTLYLSLAK